MFGLEKKLPKRCITPELEQIFPKLKRLILSRQVVLAGGTALAIQLQHRVSRDLDLFTEQLFHTDDILQELKATKLNVAVQQEERGSLILLLHDIKISLLHYPYPFLGKKILYDGIPLADRVDIAAMKVIAICQRGTRRDFVDLYFILRETPFWKVAENMVKRYGKERINPLHIGKSLVYFMDGEEDPEVDYCATKHPSWNDIKIFFRKHVRQFVFDLQTAGG